MKVKKPPTGKWNWIETKKQKPPIATMVVWFVRGRVEVGQECYEPDGTIHRFTLSGLATAKRLGYVPTLLEDYTHWCALPSAPASTGEQT